MFALYLLIHRTGGAVIRLVGKPWFGYLGSPVFRAREVAIPLRRTRSFAGAVSVPEFAITKRHRWTMNESASTRVKKV
jgi:hypothetical protein